jgi:hypothetical protein
MVMAPDDDEVLLDDESPDEADKGLLEPKLAPWKILIVDDEEQVHAVTRMVLSDFEFQERGLEFVAVYSGKEAREKIRSNPDNG